MDRHFSVEELCKSKTASRLGIQNVPDEEQLLNINALIDNVLEPVRNAFKRPIGVTSGFRCAKLNAAVGGETHSQHQKGEAADIISLHEGYQGTFLIAKIIVRIGGFDQCILENVGPKDLLPQWVHVSFKRDGNNRGQILKKVINEKGYKVVTKKELGL